MYASSGVILSMSATRLSPSYLNASGFSVLMDGLRIVIEVYPFCGLRALGLIIFLRINACSNSSVPGSYLRVICEKSTVPDT